MMTSVDYESWCDFLYREGAVCSPAELHGLLCASACTDDPKWLQGALEVLDIPDDASPDTLQTALSALFEIVHGALADDQLRLQLLLPEDSLSLAARCEALAAWCQGFLHGLGRLGDQLGARVDEQARDALHDLAKIAELEHDVEGLNDVEADADLMELVEYTRMVALSIYTQLKPQAGAPQPQLH